MKHENKNATELWMSLINDKYAVYIYSLGYLRHMQLPNTHCPMQT